LVRLIDRETGLPLANCEITAGEETTRTDDQGRVNANHGQVRFAPLDGHAFEAVNHRVGTDTREIAVKARFQIQLLGVTGCLVTLREIAENDQERAGFTRSADGLLLGPALQLWRDSGRHWLETTSKPLVLEVERGTITPPHGIWRAESLLDDQGRRHIRIPDRVTPARVSQVFSGHPGTLHRFEVVKDSDSARIEYFLTGNAQEGGEIQLLSVRTINEQDTLVKMLDKRTAQGTETTIVFEAVPAGSYVVRSALTRGDQVDLAWQRVDVLAGLHHSFTESDGQGAGVAWIDGRLESAIVVDLSCGETDNVAVHYGAFELGGILSIAGLLDTSGSIRFYDRILQEDDRLSFDLTRNPRLRLCK